MAPSPFWSWYPFFSGLKGRPKGRPRVLGGPNPKMRTRSLEVQAGRLRGVCGLRHDPPAVRCAAAKAPERRASSGISGGKVVPSLLILIVCVFLGKLARTPGSNNTCTYIYIYMYIYIYIQRYTHITQLYIGVGVCNLDLISSVTEEASQNSGETSESLAALTGALRKPLGSFHSPLGRSTCRLLGSCLRCRRSPPSSAVAAGRSSSSTPTSCALELSVPQFRP